MAIYNFWWSSYLTNTPPIESTLRLLAFSLISIFHDFHCCFQYFVHHASLRPAAGEAPLYPSYEFQWAGLSRTRTGYLSIFSRLGSPYEGGSAWRGEQQYNDTCSMSYPALFSHSHVSHPVV